MDESNQPARDWALRLFNKSPLKQRKLSEISALLDSVEGKTCLDIGSDNGVISLLLRERGGLWSSADLIPSTVASIRSLVGERVDQIDGLKTPYHDNQFDLVVIVDFLEHIETDREFLVELYRIIKPGGVLIANVPNPKEGLWRKFKALLGQTDAAHGHVRPGYSLADLENLFSEKFKLEKHSRYSRIFSDLIDTAITFALEILQRGSRSKKGTVVTGQDLNKLKKSFKLYSLIYPIIALFVRFDNWVPFLHSNMLIVRAKIDK